MQIRNASICRRSVALPISLFLLLFVAPAAFSHQQATEQQPPTYLELRNKALSLFNPLVGDWTTPSDDPALEKQPERKNRVLAAFDWGPRKDFLFMREHFTLGADRTKSLLTGFVFWQPVDQKIRFYATTWYGAIFEGEYRALDDNRIERTYTVFYPDDKETIPEPELGGRTRRFREIFTPRGPDRYDVFLDTWRDGKWIPWALVGGKYSIQRRSAAG